MHSKLFMALLAKEWREMLRDRRALSTFAFMVFGFPLLYASIIGLTVNKAKEDSKKPIAVEVYGAKNARDLVSFLKTNDITVNQQDQAFDQTLFVAGGKEVALVFSEQFDISQFAAGDSTRNLVTLYVNQKEKNADKTAIRLARVIGGYSKTIAIRRLMIRGVHPQLVHPIKVKKIELHERNRVTSFLMQLLGAVLSIACFISTIYLSVDLVAGEKFRNSLEPLLVTPNSRLSFLLPKFTIILVMVLIAVVCSTLFYTEITKLPIFERIVGIHIDIPYSLAFTSILLFLPLAILGASIQLFISTIAKSVKEAQGYASIVGVTGMLPSMMANQIFDKSEGVLAYIPSISQGLLMEKIILEKQLSAAEYLKSGSVAIVVSLILLGATYYIFNSERVFERSA